MMLLHAENVILNNMRVAGTVLTVQFISLTIFHEIKPTFCNSSFLNVNFLLIPFLNDSKLNEI